MSQVGFSKYARPLRVETDLSLLSFHFTHASSSSSLLQFSASVNFCTLPLQSQHSPAPQILSTSSSTRLISRTRLSDCSLFGFLVLVGFYLVFFSYFFHFYAMYSSRSWYCSAYCTVSSAYSYHYIIILLPTRQTNGRKLLKIDQ